MDDNRIFSPRWNTAVIAQEFDENEILWRYFPLDKFLLLFSQEGIYFRRLDKLEDQHEGIPRGEHFLRSVENIHNYPDLEFVNRYRALFSEFRKTIYASCWNRKKEESYLLWKCYSDINSGIAIKTRYKYIKEYFSEYKEDLPLFFCSIHYEDTLLNKSHWSAAFSKRPIFSEENEFRIIHKPKDNSGYGIIIKGNIINLIEEVYLAPKMSHELEIIIRKELEQFGIYSDKIKKSSLFKKLYEDE